MKGKIQLQDICRRDTVSVSQQAMNYPDNNRLDTALPGNRGPSLIALKVVLPKQGLASAILHVITQAETTSNASLRLELKAWPNTVSNTRAYWASVMLARRLQIAAAFCISNEHHVSLTRLSKLFTIEQP